MVLTPSIFAKDPSMRLKRKRLGPTIDLKVGRRKMGEARVAEPVEGGEEDTPCIEEGEEDIWPTEQEATETRFLVRPEKGKYSEIAFTFCYNHQKIILGFSELQIDYKFSENSL